MMVNQTDNDMEISIIQDALYLFKVTNDGGNYSLQTITNDHSIVGSYIVALNIIYSNAYISMPV
jgi:hypothetical protein